ncbi:VanW family protein [Patescibacteria group bacterium]
MQEKIKKLLSQYRKKPLSKGIFVILIFLGIVILIIGLYNLLFLEKIYPGVTFWGSPLGGLSKKAATGIFKKQIQEKQLYKKELLIFKSNQVWKINFDDINFEYLFDKTADKAALIGRQGNIFQKNREKIQVLKKGFQITLDYSLDETLLEKRIASIAAAVRVDPVDPIINLRSKQFSLEQRVQIDPGDPGQILDQENLKKNIKQRCANLDFSPLEIEIKTISIPLSEENIQVIKIAAGKVLEKRIKLALGNKNWLLEEIELVGFLNVKGEFDKLKILNYLESISPSIDLSPKNASFEFFNNRVISFRPARKGQVLDKEKTAKNILAILNQPSLKEEQGLELIVNQVKPKITTADSNVLGIKELLGKGQSWFDGSISSRTHNLKLAASKFHGELLAPGEILSFNDKIGEINEATGYKKAYIIKNGRTVLGDGGGVCQVSTTLFRSALDAGLPIIERYPHAYRVSYYEQKSQPGLDATVFSPSVDFKFKNDTSSYILVQAKTDLLSKSLTISLYGTTDGRQVILSKSEVWDQTPPPPALYQEDPTLPPGAIKQIDWAAWGAKVSFSWQVVRNEQTLHKKTFYSYYRPWQAVYLAGKKQ